MRIEVFSLCDAATDNAGKLNVLGAFDTIWARNTPVIHPQFAIALRIRFEHDERGEHKVTVNFVDLDGRHIISPANGIININFPDEVRTGISNLILNIQQLRIERCGEYSIDLSIDGRREASLPLLVRQPR